VFRVLQSIGPTNTRRYHVAVYFRGERLATGIGHSIQQAEMNTAANALKEKAGTIKPSYLLVLLLLRDVNNILNKYILFVATRGLLNSSRTHCAKDCH